MQSIALMYLGSTRVINECLKGVSELYRDTAYCKFKEVLRRGFIQHKQLYRFFIQLENIK